MRRRSLVVGALLLAWPCVALAQTADEIVQKNYEARGGLDKIKSVETARIHGTMTMGGQSAPFTFEWKSPAKTRFEITVQDMVGVTAFDGERGWQFMPFVGQTEPLAMADDELESAKDESDFHGPLVDYREKGHEVTLLGKEERDGMSYYKLQLTKNNGDVQLVYIDAETYLEVRNEASRTMQGMDLDIEFVMEDFREVEGLTVPHRLHQKVKGAPVDMTTMVFETVEFGVDIPDERFEMPEATAEDPGEAASGEN